MKTNSILIFILAVQHERKPLVDRKNDAHKNAQSSENGNDLNKSRGKRDASGSSVNYLSLFQLNPLLMHAANASQFPSLPQTTSPSKESPIGLKIDEQQFVNENDEKLKSESNELYESVLEQKMLNDTLDMIQMVENPSYENLNGNYDGVSQSFLLSLFDENLTQFKVRIQLSLLKLRNMTHETQS